MIYRFEKSYELSWCVEIEADSFEEAKQKLEDENPMWDEDNGGETYLTSSRCLEFEDEDAAADFDDYNEIEWEP